MKTEILKFKESSVLTGRRPSPRAKENDLV